MNTRLVQSRFRLAITSVTLLAVMTSLVALRGDHRVAIGLLCSLMLTAIVMWIYVDRQLFELSDCHDKKLKNANEQVERARLLESEFLANMGHELRTPLSTVIGISEMLLEESEEQAETELVQSMSRISVSGRRLLRLLNELLDLASIESGKMRLIAEHVAIKDAIEDVVKQMQPMARDYGNAIDIQFESQFNSIFTDSKRLRQILLHLLGNACRFTRDGQITVAVNSESHGEDDNWILFRISDNGRGIEPDLIAQMREMFLHSEGAQSIRKGNIGLRLSVCQRLGQLMSGHIEVESTPGQGSKFTVRLPLIVSTTDTDIWIQ